MAEDEHSIQINQEKELTAIHTAKEKANAAKWGLNSVVALFGILIVVIILIARDTDINLVGGLAALGLLTVWIVGWRRGKQLYSRFYVEEYSNLQTQTAENINPQGLLSSREIQVLNYAAEGFSNKQIGLKLGISESTVKYFVSSSMTKLEANDRTHAVVQAIKRGIISI